MIFVGFLLILLSLAHSQNSNAAIQGFTATVEPVIEVIMPDSISLSIPEADNKMHMTDFNIKVATNNQTGYTFYGNLASTNMNHSAGGSSLSNVYSGSTSCNLQRYQTNTWCVALHGEDGAETVMWTTNTEFAKTAQPSIEDTYNFTLSARVDTGVKAGRYNGTLNYYIVANPTPNTIAYIDYLQQITNDTVVSMIPGEYYHLKDQRDGKTYWITYKDGEVKMAQNLDYDIVAGGTLNPETTNVSTATTLSSATIQGELANDWISSLTAPQSLDEGVIYKMSDEDIYTDLHRCVRDGYGEFECQRGMVGNSYNWSAAVAMNDTSSLVTPGEVLDSQSICPARWQLPGYIDGDLLSSTIPSDKAAPGKIRCFGIKPMFTMNYISDNYYEEATSSQVLSYGWGDYDFNISTNTPYHFDISHELAGWATQPKQSTPEYFENKAYTVSEGEKTLYAVWKDKNFTLDDITYMQDITATIIKNTPDGVSRRLIDKRDNKKYWVTKYGDEDGDIWMTQNLDYDAPRGATLSLDYRTSDLITGTRSYAVSQPGYERDGGEYYFADGRVKTSTEGLAEDDERYHYHIGNYYSLYTAKLNSFSGKSAVVTRYDYAADGGLVKRDYYDYYQNDRKENTNYSICPKGWGLPTNAEFKKLSRNNAEKYNVYGGYLVDEYVVTFEGVESLYASNSVLYEDLNSNYLLEENEQKLFFFDFGASGTPTIYNGHQNASVTTPVRCIARKDININNPTASRLIER